MKSLDKFCLFETNTTNQAIEKIITNSENERLVFIINKNYKILGTLSEGDIMRALLVNKNIDNVKVTSIMNKSFKFLLKNNQTEAKKLMKKFNITLIPVVNKSLIIKSVIRLKDII
tara:strand:- start:343 stop:690 length:348 start_codon:yes stop_codon:yes gene_type:complete